LLAASMLLDLYRGSSAAGVECAPHNQSRKQSTPDPWSGARQ
jgi:hypothetical protein